MFTTVSKKIIKYRNNNVGIKVEKLDEVDHYRVIVACAKRGKKVVGRLTCKEAGVKAATKRLLRYQVIV